MIKYYEHYIFRYLNEILEFENELKNVYQLQDIPFNELDKFPKSGLLVLNQKNIEYSYHGNGCTFKYDDIEITYDIYANRVNYIATSPFSIMTYINSYSFKKDHNEKPVTQVEVLKYLDELSILGAVKKIFENYLVYEISLVWYANFLKK